MGYHSLRNANRFAPISRHLRAWRRRRKLSQTGAARALGVSVRTFQEWEQGRRQPRGLARVALDQALRRSSSQSNNNTP